MRKLKEVVIDTNNFPEVFIAGERFELLCEYAMKGDKKVDASVYFNPIDLDVIIELKEKNVVSKAIVDLFSLRSQNISTLFDFVDMTLSKEEGFVSYSRDDFLKYLVAAMEIGGYYPTLCKEKIIADELFSHNDVRVSLVTKMRAGFLQKEKFKELQNLIEEHTVSVVYMDAEKAKEVYSVQKPDETYDDEPSYEPADTLLEGWNWEKYYDGSGSLKGPNGEAYFHYDLFTIPGGVEYKESSKDRWSSFEGHFDEFKEFAESIVKSQYLSLEAKISGISWGAADNKHEEINSKYEKKIKTQDR